MHPNGLILFDKKKQIFFAGLPKVASAGADKKIECELYGASEQAGPKLAGSDIQLVWSFGGKHHGPDSQYKRCFAEYPA